MGFRPVALALALIAFGSAAAQTPPRGGAPAGMNAVLLHNDLNFRGAAVVVATSRPDLLAGLSARSVTVQGGSWELCAQPNYKGRCVTTASSLPSLAKAGLDKGVRSIRPADGVRPVRGQTGPSLKGMASEYFPAPRGQGGRVIACPTGGVAAACVNRQAASYCAALGYLKQRSVDIEMVAGKAYLADLLCSRS
jgi:hypothetical protein